MLSILSRTAQIRGSCCCPQCLHTAPGLARTGNALRPQYWTSSTLWFSDIFAAAATFDASFKIQRRQNWNQAIDEARQEADLRTADARSIERNQPPDIGEQSLLGLQEAASTEGRYKAAGNAQPESDTAIEAAQDFEADVARNLDSSADRSHIPEWPTNTGQEFNRYHLPPQSIYAPRRAKKDAEASRWVEKKVRRLELSMDMLQLKFFLWLHRFNAVDRVARVVPEPYAALMSQDKAAIEAAFQTKKDDFDRLLKTWTTEDGRFEFDRSPGDVRLCTYVEDDLGAFRDEQRQLRRHIELLLCDVGIYKSLPDGHLQILGKVFHLLSSSSAPPNVDVYNTLIQSVHRIGLRGLTENIVSSFVNSKMRPNEVSLAVILGAYTDTDNLKRFRDWMSLIRGQRGGLMEAAPWLGRFKASKGRVIPREGKPDRLIQLPCPTPMVFDAIVKGVLHFGGFKDALEVCRQLGNEGWALDMRGFGILLADCAVRSDWDSGLAVWNQILRLKEKSTKIVNGRRVSDIIMTPLFADMLRLCRRCEQKRAFADVWEQAARTHPRQIQQIMAAIRAESDPQYDRPTWDKSGSMPPASDAFPAEPRLAAASEARPEPVQALASLRAQNLHNRSESLARQEYLALQADVDFLRSLKGNAQASRSKARTWTELAKSAYGVIAAHPDTLEKRVSLITKEHTASRSDRARPTSYTDLAKNAYHLVADHPSMLEKRSFLVTSEASAKISPTPGMDSSRFEDVASRIDPDPDEGILQQRGSSMQDQGRESSDSTVTPTGGARDHEPLTYTSLATHAYRLVADHPSTLERRERDKSEAKQDDVGNRTMASSARSGHVERRNPDDGKQRRGGQDA